MILRRVLQRKDKYFNQALLSLKKVKLHFYNDKWNEGRIEGPLYLYNRHSKNKLKLIIFDTILPKEFKMNINKEIEYIIINQFFIFKNNEKIIGLWVYDKEDSDLLEEYIKKYCIN
ncbi:hypothetical protein TUBRATIS_11230 [Tubulinosema ratisbonensis]|uniref:Uncharacterized protein n=1 Tax=Tubulinosema ratisbonensis TaxID=291195 RepID=A0A437AMF3_9MICR|nr:hypothetical protein TUBRATIS_11230 [Tubulinosema ratisbonensis]